MKTVFHGGFIREALPHRRTNLLLIILVMLMAHFYSSTYCKIKNNAVHIYLTYYKTDLSAVFLLYRPVLPAFLPFSFLLDQAQFVLPLQIVIPLQFVVQFQFIYYISFILECYRYEIMYFYCSYWGTCQWLRYFAMYKTVYNLFCSTYMVNDSFKRGCIHK